MKNPIAKIVIVINIASYFILAVSISILAAFGSLIVEISDSLILILVSIGSIFWFLLPATLSYFYKERRKWFIVILIINLLIAIVFIIFIVPSILNPYRNIGGGAAHVYNQVSRDIMRSRDLSSIRIALDIYKEKNGGYPLNLQELVNGGYLTNDVIVDPVTQIMYEYGVNNNQDDYVIKIQFGILPPNVELNRHLKEAGEDLINQRLASDLDGVLYEIDCNDPYYCMGPLLYKTQ